MKDHRITVSSPKNERPRLETIISYLRGDAVSLDVEEAVKVLFQIYNSKKSWRNKYRHLKLKIEDYIYQMKLNNCNSVATALSKIIEDSKAQDAEAESGE